MASFTLSTHPIIFQKSKNPNILCSSNNNLNSTDNNLNSTNQKQQSLSQQLKHLSKTKTHPKTTFSPPKKSTWLNPTKPKRSVIQLHRQKRTLYSNPTDIADLKNFTQRLKQCGCTEDEFLRVVRDFPCRASRENVVLVLNGLVGSWEKSVMFLGWVKGESGVEIETVFYNLVFKALRLSGRFVEVEDLVDEMVGNGVGMDNITYSTIIGCAKRCGRFDKAVEWFEMMYRTGVMPDEVTYSAVLDVYAKMGKVEESLGLYERGRGNEWMPDVVAFSVMGKMFAERGDLDGVRFVLREMESVGVKGNVGLYNSLIDAVGRAGKPRFARSLFEEMVGSAGLMPNEKTLTSLVKIYGKARWEKDAVELWERMKVNGWPMDFILYNTLLNVCADLGNEEKAEKLFEDMKGKEGCKPDSWSYTAMLKIYGSTGNVEKSMKLFEEMCELGIQLNVMGCTCLIQCLGKAKRIDDLVRVYCMSTEKGIRVDDRLCGCLLSVLSMCDVSKDAEKVIACLRQANPKLVTFIELLQEDGTSFETVKEEFKTIISKTANEARRPFCNCLIDLCRNKGLDERSHELLYLGTLYGLYPSLHKKNAEEWSMDVRSLSVGAAHTAFEEWMGTLCKLIQRGEALPELFLAHTGAGTHKFSQGLANDFASHAKKLAAPFKQHETKVGCFVATRGELESWVQSRNIPSVA